MNVPAYCRARIGDPIDAEDGMKVKFMTCELADWDTVVAFLQSTYDRFATRVADANSRRPRVEARDLSRLGGFGVRLMNRFGGQIEVGVGRKLWLLLNLRPGTQRAHSDQSPQEGMLGFYLDGWHYTDWDMAGLVSRDECLRCVQQWLETGEFPERNKRND
jgi:hypothetical protein